jgi:hypothetical protein
VKQYSQAGFTTTVSITNLNAGFDRWVGSEALTQAGLSVEKGLEAAVWCVRLCCACIAAHSRHPIHVTLRLQRLAWQGLQCAYQAA